MQCNQTWICLKKKNKVDAVCVSKMKGELMELSFEVWIKENWVMTSNLKLWLDKRVIALVDEVRLWCTFLLFHKEQSKSHKCFTCSALISLQKHEFHPEHNRFKWALIYNRWCYRLVNSMSVLLGTHSTTRGGSSVILRGEIKGRFIGHSIFCTCFTNNSSHLSPTSTSTCIGYRFLFRL